jgi:hypothetical protein
VLVQEAAQGLVQVSEQVFERVSEQVFAREVAPTTGQAIVQVSPQQVEPPPVAALQPAKWSYPTTVFPAA